MGVFFFLLLTGTSSHAIPTPFEPAKGVHTLIGHEVDGGRTNGIGSITGNTWAAMNGAPWMVRSQDAGSFGEVRGYRFYPDEGFGFDYNPNGEQTGRSFSTWDYYSNDTLKWDALGRLVHFQVYTWNNSPAYRWQVTYDGLGRRLRYQYGGNTAMWSTYDPEVEFLEIQMRRHATGAQGMGETVTKIYGPDTSGTYGGSQGEGGLLGAIELKSGTSTYAMRAVVSDLLGNAVARNRDGTWQWTNTNVTAYGPQTAWAWDSGMGGAGPTDYTAHVHWRGRAGDVGGMVYLGARYYDAATRTFLSPDPLDYHAGLNLYSYAAGDPINLTDPDGRIAKETFSINTYKESLSLFSSSADSWKMGDINNRALAVLGVGTATIAVTATTIDNITNVIPGLGQGKAAVRTGIKHGISTGLEAIGRSAAHHVDDFAPAAKTLPPLRQQYVDDVLGLKDLGLSARAAGQNAEATARMLHAERNALKLQYRELTPPDVLKTIEARNLKLYGDPLGPSVDQLRAAGKSWDDIIESAARPGGSDLGF
jgi:RHS repeat-associated protein